MVFTANGDVYLRQGGEWNLWSHAGNVFGGPVPTTQETWGSVKSRYRGQRVPTPTDR